MNKTNQLRIGVLLLIVGVILGFSLSKFSIGTLLIPPVKNPKLDVNEGPEYSHRQPISTDFTKLYPKVIIRQGDPKIKALALTFDDGPDFRFTPKVLDVLKKYKIKATFFVVGMQIEKYPAVFRRMIQEGHAIGSHSYQHLKISELPPVEVKFQLDKNQEVIQKNGREFHYYYRPPYSALDPASIDLISKKGYKIILWTIDSLDWRGLKKDQVIGNVVPKLKNGYIILQHCGSQSNVEDLTGTVEALPEIIRIGLNKGYRFVTIPELLNESKK